MQPWSERKYVAYVTGMCGDLSEIHHLVEKSLKPIEKSILKCAKNENGTWQHERHVVYIHNQQCLFDLSKGETG